MNVWAVFGHIQGGYLRAVLKLQEGRQATVPRGRRRKVKPVQASDLLQDRDLNVGF